MSRCGGLGTYGATRRTPQEIRYELAELRRLAGDAPIGVNLVLPPGMPEDDDPDAIERELPERHKAFVRGLYEKYEVPPPKRRGMRTRFLRSNEIARGQMEAVLASDVDLVACGIGMPADFVERCKRAGKRIVGQQRVAVDRSDLGDSARRRGAHPASDGHHHVLARFEVSLEQ